MAFDVSGLTPEYIRALEADVSRNSFRQFIESVQPSYIFNWHNSVLIEALQSLADRNFQRLIVMMPPRHGKSELVSRLFPAWCFARNQNEQIILSSYSIDLASAMSRDCQRIIQSPEYTNLFPDTRLSDGRDSGAIKTSKRFDIVGSKGYYLAAGVGGGITGAGATVAIIDDPVKNSEEADSITYRNKAWEWYTTTFKTRFEPGCIEIICQTRWHEDDLTGRILLGAKQDENTKIISLPAICEEQEPSREIGDPLWEGKYSRAALLDIQREIGTRAWTALYQQKPTPGDGGVIKKAWFSRYDPLKMRDELAALPVNFFFDTAYTDQEKNDPCAGIAYVKRAADFFVLDYESKYLDFSAQIEFIKTFSAKNGYTPQSVIRVEPKATGKSVVQVVKRYTELNVKEGVPPKDSKIARVNSVSAVLESGRVYLPDRFGWVDSFLTGLAAFPNAAHDEDADCLTGMLQNEGIGKMKIHY